MTKVAHGSGHTNSDADAERRATVRSLYQDHVEEIYRYVHRRCGDRSLAEDVSHDVFIRLADLADPEAVSIAWLKTVARNRMIDLLRRRDDYSTKVGELQRRRDVGRSKLDTADVLAVELALAELWPMHRMVLMLRYVDGYSSAEIARLIDRSVKGVDGLTARAKAALRAQLEVNDV